MFVLILLACGILATAVYVNRYIFNWHAERVAVLKRRDAELELWLRRAVRKQEKVHEAHQDLEDTVKLYENLAEKKAFGIADDPSEWLLEKEKISLNQFGQARKYAEKMSVSFVEACLALNFIDRKTAREVKKEFEGEPMPEKKAASAPAGPKPDK